MAIKGYSRSPEMVPYHQMQFIVIARTPLLFGGEGSLLCKGFRQRIFNPADWIPNINVLLKSFFEA